MYVHPAQNAELREQVVHARAEMPIGRVVYMGMGEPSHNLDNVLAAAARMRDELMISTKRQTLSTVGGVKVIERMQNDRNSDLRHNTLRNARIVRCCVGYPRMKLQMLRC